MISDKDICELAHKVALELWGSEHLQCLGNLEIKMQEIIKEIKVLYNKCYSYPKP